MDPACLPTLGEGYNNRVKPLVLLRPSPRLREIRSWPWILAWIITAIPSLSSGKLPVSLLGAYMDTRDSAFIDGLNRDLAQDLAEDTAFLVYDLRKKHGGALDSAHANGGLRDRSLLGPMASGIVKWGLVVECQERKEEIFCRLEAVAIATGQGNLIDTVHMLPEAGEKRKLLSQALVKPINAYFFPKKKSQPNMGSLKIKPPANPAMLVRGMQIMKRGEIAEIPLGSTLVIGDAPHLLVIDMENVHYVLYPHSSYTYMLPKVVQLNHGSLGILKGIDSSSIEGKLRSATALDSSNLIWRSLARVAALDSSNVLWKGLGRVTSLDSHNLILKNLAKVTSLDSNNLLFKTLGKVTALDTTNLLLRTLTQVAALDSSNLVWKGLGQVSALDSNNLIWKKLSQVATLDSNSIWRKLGLLAFQDNSVVLTPSLISRGQPQAVLFRHEGSMSTMEVVKGSMSSQPLLSSQEPVTVGALRVVRTRGFSLKQERLNPVRGDHILRELESANPARGSRNFIMFLPGKFFAQGSSLRTADRPIQGFITSEFREMDMEMDVLSSEKEGWNEFSGAFRTGTEERGCYLCSPDRLGP